MATICLERFPHDESFHSRKEDEEKGCLYKKISMETALLALLRFPCVVLSLRRPGCLLFQLDLIRFHNKRLS